MFGLFSFIYGVKIEEATRRFSEYTTFTDFFTRTLKPNQRPIHREQDLYSICSPCDGTVLSTGLINSADSTIDCVKGRSYRLDEFMIGVIGDDGD
jgi:phosphatidylserine decarboxylase